MTIQLTIPTPFADLAELTENFAQRVDEQRLMLPNAEPITEGEWVQFEVQLADGTAALAGVGRVQGAFDNGEEHPAEYRFDVVVDSLQLEGMHEVMFERLLVAREGQQRGEPVTGEVSVEELERAEAARAAATADDTGAEAEAASEGAVGGWEEAADDATQGGYAEAEEPMEAAPSDVEPGTGEVDVGDMEPVAAPRAASVRPAPPAAAKAAPKAAYPAAAPSEPGKLPSPHTFNGRALTRPTHPAAWSPEPAVRPDPAQSSGLFDYQGGVPRPAHPPRPELDASQRVQAAPRPGAPWPRRPTGTHPVVAAEEPAEEAFEDLGEGEQAMAGGGETAQLEAPAGDREDW